MPQVHNKQISMSFDSTAFGKNSRYMSSLKYSEGTIRRIKAFNIVENRLNKYRVRYFNRHAEILRNRYHREEMELINNLKKTLAYKAVCNKNSIENTKDYQKALDKNYSQYALRHEIEYMLNYIQPDKVRARKADALIDENRKRYDMLVQRNRKMIDRICPPRPIWRGYLVEKDDSDDEYEDVDGSETSSVASAKKERRENINRTKEQNKPPYLSRSPTKAVLPLKKQGVTKAFMMSRDPTRASISPTKYELPPVQLRKKMDPSLQITTEA